jgi:hypothetical protein
MENVWQALGDLKEMLPEPGFHAQVVKKINENLQSRSRGRFQWLYQQFFSSPLTVCALLVLGILAGTFLGNNLVRSDLFPFRQSQFSHFQAASEVFSLRAFDPIPPGTLGGRYLHMADYGEEGRR